MSGTEFLTGNVQVGACVLTTLPCTLRQCNGTSLPVMVPRRKRYGSAKRR